MRPATFSFRPVKKSLPKPRSSASSTALSSSAGPRLAAKAGISAWAQAVLCSPIHAACRPKAEIEAGLRAIELLRDCQRQPQLVHGLVDGQVRLACRTISAPSVRRRRRRPRPLPSTSISTRTNSLRRGIDRQSAKAERPRERHGTLEQRMSRKANRPPWTWGLSPACFWSRNACGYAAPVR